MTDKCDRQLEGAVSCGQPQPSPNPTLPLPTLPSHGHYPHLNFKKHFSNPPPPHHTQPWPLSTSRLLLRKMGMNSIQISKSLLHGLNSRIFFPNPPCLDVATSLNMNCCSAECDISSQNFSVSRLFYYFESLSLGLKNGLSILVSVSKLFVSKRRISLGL